MGEYRGKYGGNPNLHRGRERLNRALTHGFPDVARFRAPWTSGRNRPEPGADHPKVTAAKRPLAVGFPFRGQVVRHLLPYVACF